MVEERVERRLAAILCADVAGYSRLMGADEEGTLAVLKSDRRELIDPLIAQHRGRIFKTSRREETQLQRPHWYARSGFGGAVHRVASARQIADATIAGRDPSPHPRARSQLPLRSSPLTVPEVGQAIATGRKPALESITAELVE